MLYSSVVSVMLTCLLFLQIGNSLQNCRQQI